MANINNPEDELGMEIDQRSVMTNPKITRRFEELLRDGESLRIEWAQQKDTSIIKNTFGFTKWTTSCLNLLDHLSTSTNRFVTEFESWAMPGNRGGANILAALGVLWSAYEEYKRGLAIEYHLSVASAVFGGLLSQSEYLLKKKYLRAAAVLMGAALEQALKERAMAEGIEISEKDTITPLLHKLKAPEVGVINELEAKRLESVATIRNDATHHRSFSYTKDDLIGAMNDVKKAMSRLLGER